MVTDRATGLSRGYAFVRFSSEDEHKDALMHMNGFNGMANKPIRVSLAVPRKPNFRSVTLGLLCKKKIKMDK